MDWKETVQRCCSRVSRYRDAVFSFQRQLLILTMALVFMTISHPYRVISMFPTPLSS